MLLSWVREFCVMYYMYLLLSWGLSALILEYNTPYWYNLLHVNFYEIVQTALLIFTHFYNWVSY